MNDDRTAAWGDFWRQEAGNAVGGCLAQADADIAAAEDALWRPFALTLPKKSRLLDLGTGDGAVLKRLRALRPDLRLIGVDSAPFLPAAPKGMELKAGVAMERLPFANSSVEAVVSRFGYEYGDTAAAAGQVGRVLRPGGRLLLLVHHRGGAVTGHNEQRAAAIRSTAFDSGAIDQARALAAARRMAMLPTPRSFHDAVQQAAREHPQQPVAAEIRMGIVRALDPRLGADGNLRAVDELQRRARSELARLEALSEAARDRQQIEALAEELRQAGLQVDQPRDIQDRGGRPFGWIVVGARPGGTTGRGTSR